MPKSIERVAFAAMAGLTLAPVFIHTVWLLVASKMGAQADSTGLTVGSLLLATVAAICQIFFRQQILAKSILVLACTGFIIAIVLGDLQSILAIAIVFAGLSVFVSCLIHWLIARLPRDVDGSAMQHKVQAGFWVLLAVFTIWQTSKISTFMGDSKRAELSVLPAVPFFRTHSCLTAYVQALKLAKAGEDNLYDASLWPDEKLQMVERDSEMPPTGSYAPFYLDTYLYPPQFLLLPATIFAISDDFQVQRAIWFGFCALLLAIGFWMVAMWLGEKGKRRALWLIPLLWSSLLIMITLQIGNVHHVIMALAVMAMIAFENKKPILGGALLAFTIVSKLSPGLLVVILLVQRRWRDAAWTMAFGIAYTLLTAIVLGIQPLSSFLSYELPRILSGEAMDFLDSSTLNILINAGPFSLPFKLSLLGVPFDDLWGTARLLNTLYTVAILGLTVRIALQKRARFEQICFWLSVLAMSSLQSPFSPGYVIMPVFWLLTVIATDVKTIAGTITVIAICILLFIPPPDAQTVAVFLSLTQQLVVFGVMIFALFRKRAPSIPMLQPV